MDREKVISWLEGLAEDDWRECYSDSEVQETARQALNLIDELLKEQEARELTIDEWREWKNNPKRNPICKLWEYDTSPIWVLNQNEVHEPALLMGKLKLFTGKPTFEQCKEVKWDEHKYLRLPNQRTDRSIKNDDGR